MLPLLLALLIPPAAIRAHMAFLADDLLEGRGTATRGHEIAARYVEATFAAAGLETSLQQVPLKRIELNEKASRVELVRAGGVTTLIPGKDYVMSGAGFPNLDVEGPVEKLLQLSTEKDADWDIVVRSIRGAPSFKPSDGAWLSLEASNAVRADMPLKVHIVKTSRVEEVRSPNVIGILRGTDPKLRDEYVVISAHLDHLGRGQAVNGDDIYNGAVDNASGVAAILEVARAFAAQPPRRSLMFVAFTAEEPGDLGSAYFVANPPVAKATLVADINIDGGSVWAYQALIARGGEQSTLGHAAEAAGKKVVADPFPEKFTSSDQHSFAEAGIPAILLTSQRTAEARPLALAWLKSRYHAPGDDMSQPLDFDAAAEFTRDLFAVVQAVANDDARPRFVTHRTP
jgi:hypothetical protein